jgi:hypothetical protein
MQVNYCDLCGQPLKERIYFTLYVKDPSVKSTNDEDAYWEMVAKIQRDVKVICPSCKHVFDQIFELRLKRLCELTEEINSMYNLKSKKNPKERKNGEEKK